MRNRYSSYGGFGPYVPVATRKARGAKEVATISKKLGRAADPVVIAGRHITTTFWGQAWCDNLERYSDFSNRLPRGRTYVRNGSVLDLNIAAGKVEAHVAGSELYTVKIGITRLAPARWKSVIASCSTRIGSLIGLLRGELEGDVLAALTHRETGLFPAPREIDLRCSCPDGAYVCKHIAAVMYGVGARLDLRPELFFLLRQVDQAELIGSALKADVLGAAFAQTTATGKRRIASSAVASVFGIELEEAAPAASKKVGIMQKNAAGKTAKQPAKKVAKKTAKKVAKKTARTTAKKAARTTTAKKASVLEKPTAVHKGTRIRPLA